MTETYMIEDILLDRDAKLLWERQSGQAMIRAYADSESLHVIQGKMHSNGITDFETSMCSFDTIVELFVEDEFAQSAEADMAIVRTQLSSQLGSECVVYKSCELGADNVFFIIPALDDEPHELAICLVQGEGTHRSATVAATIHRSLISAPFSEQKKSSAFTM